MVRIAHQDQFFAWRVRLDMIRAEPGCVGLQPFLRPRIGVGGVLLRFRRIERPPIVVHRQELQEQRISIGDRELYLVRFGAGDSVDRGEVHHFGEEVLHRLHLVGARPAPAQILAGHLVAVVALDALAQVEGPGQAVLGLLPALCPASGDLLLTWLIGAGAADAVFLPPDRFVLDDLAAIYVGHHVLGFHREGRLVERGRTRGVGGDQGDVLRVLRRRGTAGLLR